MKKIKMMINENEQLNEIIAEKCNELNSFKDSEGRIELLLKENQELNNVLNKR